MQASQTAQTARAVWWKRPRLLAVAGSVFFALILMAVIIIKVRVQPADGEQDKGKGKSLPAEAIIVLENLPSDAEVLVDGATVTVKWRDSGKIATISVSPGKKHKIVAKKDGIQVLGEEVVIEEGKRGKLTARLLPEPENQPQAQTAEVQVKAVAAKLKERNPGFDGAVKPTIENGNATGLEFLTDHVTDLSPLRALPQLKTLTCKGSAGGKGILADLSPLKGMRLTSLSCFYNRIEDLSPLEGMPLEHLDCVVNPVNADLSPLKGMRLKTLALWGWKGKERSLSPLKGMPLTSLNCGGSEVEDLSPLAGMPLNYLVLNYTIVSDLSPLKGMPLKQLAAAHTRVSGLTPLKDMPLNSLHVDGSRVTDLSPIRHVPLTRLDCDFEPERDAPILRSIKTLENINGKPVAEFWKEVDGTELTDGSPRKEAINSLPAMSVWKGTITYRKGAWVGATVAYEIHISESDGKKFKGLRFDKRANRGDVEGEVKGETVTWRENIHGADVLITVEGKITGDSIHVTFKRSYVNGLRVEGDGELQRDGS